MKKYMIWALVLLPLMFLLCGCVGVSETTVQYTGLTKTEVIESSRSSFLGLGLIIVYDDEKRGIVQAIKETAGGSSGYVTSVGNNLVGGFSSKPAGASDFFIITVYDDSLILRIDGDTGLFGSILKRMSMSGGRFTFETVDPTSNYRRIVTYENGEVKEEYFK